jgi:hypothetical protein
MESQFAATPCQASGILANLFKLTSKDISVNIALSKICDSTD